jgi:hypothetical protein
MPESTVTDTLGKAQAFCRMAPTGGQSGVDNMKLPLLLAGAFYTLNMLITRSRSVRCLKGTGVREEKRHSGHRFTSTTVKRLTISKSLSCPRVLVVKPFIHGI